VAGQVKPASRNITTPYGAKGSAWATGEHGGVDYGCPTGDPVHAMWAGTITGTSWGSAYGTQLVIDHDPLPNGDPGLWAVYAHLQSKVRSSGRVEAGELIAHSGATGNVSGPHLHVEVQRAASWKQGNYVDPQPWIDAGGTVSSGGNYDYNYLGKPGGTFTVTRSYKDLDDSEWSPPRTGWEHTQVYLNVKPHFKAGKTHGAIRVRVMRENDDSTGHDTLPIDIDDLDADGRLMLRYYYWEAGGAGDSTVVQLMCVGGLESAEIGTRYTKRAVVVD
jgi:hypothetical protein